MKESEREREICNVCFDGHMNFEFQLVALLRSVAIDKAKSDSLLDRRERETDRESRQIMALRLVWKVSTGNVWFLKEN